MVYYATLLIPFYPNSNPKEDSPFYPVPEDVVLGTESAQNYFPPLRFCRLMQEWSSKTTSSAVNRARYYTLLNTVHGMNLKWTHRVLSAKWRNRSRDIWKDMHYHQFPFHAPVAATSAVAAPPLPPVPPAPPAPPVPPSPMACAIQALNRSACGPHDPGYNYGDGICGLRATCFLLLGPAGQKNKCLIPALEDLQRACDSNFDHFLDVSSLGKKYRDPEERGTRETKKTRAKNNLDAHVLRQTQNWLLGRDGNGMAWHIGNHHDDIALAKTWFDREAVYYDDTAQEVLMNYRLLITKVMPLNLAPMISCDPRTDMLHNFKGQVEELSLVNILILVKKSVSSSNYEVQLWRHIKLNVAVQLCVQHTSVAPRMIRYTGNHWDATFVAQNAWHQVCDRFSAVDMLPELPPPYTTSTVVIK